MRVLGIDPGYAIVGWGVVDYVGNRFAPVDFGAVCTDAGVPFERRLDEVYTGVREVIERTNAFQLLGDSRGEQGDLGALVGLLAHRLRPVPLKDRNRLIIASDGRVEDLLEQGDLGAERLVDRVSRDASSARHTGQGRACIASFQKLRGGRFHESTPSLTSPFSSHDRAIRAAGS